MSSFHPLMDQNLNNVNILKVFKLGEPNWRALKWLQFCLSFCYELEILNQIKLGNILQNWKKKKKTYHMSFSFTIIFYLYLDYIFLNLAFLLNVSLSSILTLLEMWLDPECWMVLCDTFYFLQLSLVVLDIFFSILFIVIYNLYINME